MITGYKEFGKKFFIHGNRSRKPKNVLTEEVKSEIELLYTTKYFDCTYTKFKEFLELRENINLSIDEVKVILRDKYIFSPRTHKSTKRKFRKMLENEIKTANKKEQKQLKSNLVLAEDAHPMQPRCKYFGEVLQMDACIHPWFGKEKLLFMLLLMMLQGKVLVYTFLISKKL